MEQETPILVLKFLHTLVIQYWIASKRFGKRFFIYPSRLYFMLNEQSGFLLSRRHFENSAGFDNSCAALIGSLVCCYVNDFHTCFNRNTTS